MTKQIQIFPKKNNNFFGKNFYLCSCDLIGHNFDLFNFMFDTDVVFLGSKQSIVNLFRNQNLKKCSEIFLGSRRQKKNKEEVNQYFQRMFL